MNRRQMLLQLLASKEEVKGYLTFSSPNSFTLGIVDNQKYCDGTLEYSTDTTTWHNWDCTSAISSASDGTKHNLYLRGSNNTYITGDYGGIIRDRFALTGTNISCEGNIETLLDYQTVLAGNHPPMAINCFRYSFRENTSLISSPEFPATTLSEKCYLGMFQNCTALTSVPKLPATTLATDCYRGMFYNCTSLTSTPELPATTLASNCYAYMFSHCTSLVNISAISATVLAEGCYYSMFAECSSLTTPPALPVTTLSVSCYQSMFQNCTALTSVPKLPATTLTDYCYYSMFSGCTSLYVSDTSTSTAAYAWRIPVSGTFTNTKSQGNMFTNCAGTRSSDNMPGVGGNSYTYYTQNAPIG